MPGDVPCRSRDPFFLQRLGLNLSGFLNRRWGLSFGGGCGLHQNLLKERGTGAWFLLGRQFRMTVRVLAVASLANDFHHLVVHQACHGVVQEQAAARTIVVNRIA
jgi:hypothetical protein